MISPKNLLELVAKQERTLKEAMVEAKKKLQQLESKFYNAFAENNFNWDNIFEDFFNDIFVKKMIKDSFKNKSFHQLESFVKRHNDIGHPLEPREIDTLLESAVIHSVPFKFFKKYFINKLSKQSFAVAKNPKLDFIITWKGRLLECEKYFEQYLINAYKNINKKIEK